MGGVCHRPLYYIGDIMIILKKENHYRTSQSLEEAQELVNDGYEVLKNSFGVKIVKQEAKKAAPKKKMFAKKKK
mgnify:CR=1 FL=1